MKYIHTYSWAFQKFNIFTHIFHLKKTPRIRMRNSQLLISLMIFLLFQDFNWLHFVHHIFFNFAFRLTLYVHIVITDSSKRIVTWHKEIMTDRQTDQQTYTSNKCCSNSLVDRETLDQATTLTYFNSHRFLMCPILSFFVFSFLLLIV